MNQKNKYDTIIIGGGQAGIPLAHSLADADKKVALIERQHLGGSCVNFGCIPTKAVLSSAKIAHQARNADEFGVKIPKVETDLSAVLKRARELSEDSRKNLKEGLEEKDNPKLINGHAKIVGRDKDNNFQIQVGEEIYKTENIILNTGTRSLIPEVEGLSEIDFIDAGNWLGKEELPEHIAILGGGYIGLEMGQFYRRMGSEVTIIDGSSQIAEGEDTDIAEKLQSFLEDEGIEFCLSGEVKSVEKLEKDKIKLTIDSDSEGSQKTLTATHIFVATGRIPNTDDLGLDTIGVEVDDKGIIKVDEHSATNVKGVWAAGDIRGGMQFTPTAWDDYRVIESHILGDGSHTNDRIVPYAMFTDPELGRVGMTEAEAKKSDKKIEVNCYEMETNGKARGFGRTEGFIKVIIDTETNKIIGAAVLSFEGCEMVQGYVDLMNADKPFTNLRDSVHIHPTLFEAVQSSVKPF